MSSILDNLLDAIRNDTSAQKAKDKYVNIAALRPGGILSNSNGSGGSAGMFMGAGVSGSAGGAGGGGVVYNGTVGAGGTVAAQLQPRPPTMLSEAYAPPLQVVRDLWSARFGDEWVSRETLVDDDDNYMQHAAQRLLRANQMEHVNEYFRLIEKDLCK